MTHRAYEALLDHVPSGCLVVDDDGTVLFWNEVLEGWTGVPRAQICGRGLYDAFPRLGQPRYRSRIEQTLSFGAPAVLSALLTPPFFPRARSDGRRRSTDESGRFCNHKKSPRCARCGR